MKVITTNTLMFLDPNKKRHKVPKINNLIRLHTDF